MSLKSLEDVYVDQIADLYSAEQQLVKALPKVAEAASSSELRQAFETHLKETEGHVQRLEKVRQALDEVPDVTCKGMEGLIKEGDEIVSEEGDNAAKDAALIAAAVSDSLGDVRAWTLVTAVVVGYMISRGLAKAGSRHFGGDDPLRRDPR